MEKENALRNCAIGHIFYSDKSCSVSLDSSKTPIGVVVYVDGQGHGQVMALDNIGYYEWGKYGTDISKLSNYDSSESASYDLNSCANTQKIIAAGNKSKYPAAWAAHEYKTEGTNAGDWCLPAAGIFTSYYNNQQQVNIAMMNAGGIRVGISCKVWSSSENDSRYVWYADFGYDYDYGKNEGYGVNNGYYNEDYRINKENSLYVRPVLEF